MATSTKAKSKKVQEEVVESTEDTDELDDLEDSDEAEKPATKGSKAADADDDSFGTKELVALIKKLTGKEYSTRQLRTLIRSMARAKEGVDREITRENPTRYAWSGADDPEVKRIVKAVREGRIEKANKEVLDDLKAKGAAKREAKKAAKEKAKAESLDDDEAETDTDEDTDDE